MRSTGSVEQPIELLSGLTYYSICPINLSLVATLELTLHNKPKHKGADCNEKFDKQWPKVSESTDKCSKNVETGVVQPPTAAQNQNQKGDRKNVNSASTAWNICAVADVNQESESSDLIEHQKATSSSKTYDWFEEVITAENTDRPSDENKQQNIQRKS